MQDVAIDAICPTYHAEKKSMNVIYNHHPCKFFRWNSGRLMAAVAKLTGLLLLALCSMSGCRAVNLDVRPPVDASVYRGQSASDQAPGNIITLHDSGSADQHSVSRQPVRREVIGSGTFSDGSTVRFRVIDEGDGAEDLVAAEGIEAVRETPVDEIPSLTSAHSPEVIAESEGSNPPLPAFRPDIRVIDMRDRLSHGNLPPVCESLVSTLSRVHQRKGKGGGDGRPDARLDLTLGEVAIPARRIETEIGPVEIEPAPSAEREPIAPVVHVQESEPIGDDGGPSIRIVEPAEAIPTPAAESPESKSCSIRDIETDITVSDETPPDLSEAVFADQRKIFNPTFARSDWTGYLYQWEAPGLYHRPLYFEEINLERYGYSYCRICQPVVSGAHFFATVPILPYKTTVEPTWECIYALGHYRPGSCVPNRIHWMPLRPKAGLVQAAAITGMIYAIP